MEIVGGLVSGIATAAVTVLVIVASVLVGGIVVVARRRTRPAGTEQAVRRRAGSALVKADDRVDEGEADLQFALAQFGSAETADYRTALEHAKADRAEIFRLHRLIEEQPGSGLAQRERANRMTMLADRLDAALGSEADRFRARRTVEIEDDRVARVRTRLIQARESLVEAGTVKDSLVERFAARALGDTAGALHRASAALDRGEALAANAERDLARTRVSAVAPLLDEAERHALEAEALVGLIGDTVRRLDDAVAALDQRRVDARRIRTEALAAVDSAPDADTATAITVAIGELDAAIATGAGAGAETNADANANAAEAQGGSNRRRVTFDPIGALNEIRDALDALEVSLAAGRTQAQRLAHAREAYAGARVSAQTQIATARAALRGGGGASARTRLSQADDELALAERESGTDPVAALDAARRAITHARDAEVLAHY